MSDTLTNKAASFNDIQTKDIKHHFSPFSNNKELAEHGSRVINKAHGVYIYDDNGNKLLDAMAGLWCVNIGYGRQELVDVATKQMKELPYYNLFFKTTHAPAAKLAEKIASLAPTHMNKVFFTGSGSEANDTIFRMVRRFWDLKGQPTKKQFISRKNAYHGSTVVGASLGGMGYMHEQGDLPIEGISHIDQPYYFKEGGDDTQEAFGIKAAQSLETKILEIGENNIAAFIAEPFQGAGGVIVPPASYWPEIKRILAKYDILLVVDEVISGFGRTGEWFASQYYDLKPDLMPIAKGLSSGYLPIGGVIVGDRVAHTLIEKGGDFNHGFTYSGHPVAAAVALKNIELLESEGVIERVKNDTSPYLQKRWQELAAHPIVGETRGLGMVAGLELVKNKDTKERIAPDAKAGGICRDFSMANGLIMRPCGDTMIISPPLVITKAEIDELVEKAVKTLDETAKYFNLL
ncbi:aspartate aminotransferase family protein [Thalassotalea castellviae]|uniref:Aspartate aminotransferase family protein n=1 Tax=Thalassotalea castellviae TaxID=3075612 RepID=A0ABU3A152_9GAMM|nr:aspartate aminotransferase family protein [Thalassotalea sp. W431]MDT0603908.1 aspartate aminotransferase family protein [Thalassotalea sp. W431]